MDMLKASDQQVDLRVFELLASRLCHDIVGPIGAVNNGMEILEDEDDEFGMMGEAISLVTNSARQAADALQFYRMAYGMAGTQVGTDLSELATLAVRHGKKSKVEVDWRDRSLPASAPGGCGKLLLNLVALMVECLPRGGKVTVSCIAEGENLVARVFGEGQGANLREDTAPALRADTTIEDLTPRNIQGYFTRLLALRMKSDLLIESGEPDRIGFSVIL